MVRAVFGSSCADHGFLHLHFTGLGTLVTLLWRDCFLRLPINQCDKDCIELRTHELYDAVVNLVL